MPIDMSLVLDTNAIIDFLKQTARAVDLLALNTAIENETIAISRATKLKLPDAIIGATAIVYGAEVVSSDPHFLKCTYPALRIKH
jgi:predicted nucleic acid-binding protein